MKTEQQCVNDLVTDLAKMLYRISSHDDRLRISLHLQQIKNAETDALEEMEHADQNC